VKPLVIEVASDVICPWCYIGKKRLEKALELVKEEVRPEIRWLPFQLNPAMPPEGMPRADYRMAKFGSAERSRGLDERVMAEGRGEGIAFAFDRIERTPNTTAAHQLIQASSEKQNTVVDALFRAYFEEAKDIGDAKVLQEIAEKCGVKDWPQGADAQKVSSMEEDVRELGISAVPTFIFDRTSGVSGAYPPENLAQAMREALK
jgi:predicted DsbA family dithiol-disulfide isomerase